MTRKPADLVVPAEPRDPEFEAAIREGQEDADAGRLTPYEKVRRWLLSWGSENELPLPE